MSGLAHALRLFVAHYGLAALFVLLVFEEAGVWLPLPGDLFVMYFGYRASQSSASVLAALPALLTITAAVCCGSLVLYGLTHRYRGSVRRLGRFVRLDERRLARMERWVRRYGARIVIPGRLIPGLRVPTTAVAGLFDMPLRAFLPAVAVAALLWGAIYMTLGGLGHSLLAFVLHAHTGELLPDAPEEWVAALLTTVLMLGLLVLVLRATSHRRHQHQV